MIYTLFCQQIQLPQAFCCKNDLSTLVLLQKQSIHTFFVTKTIYTPFLSQKEFTHTFFVAKTIYALRPESFCALKVAIRKVQTFWASALLSLGQASATVRHYCIVKRVIQSQHLSLFINALFVLVFTSICQLQCYFSHTNNDGILIIS